MSRVCVDWDGTCVEDNRYPEMGDWLPGAKEALLKLAKHFDEVVIFTCRTAPVAPDERTPIHPSDEIDAIDNMLIVAGMPLSVYVWTKPYKPAADFYVDNRGIRFNGDWDVTLAAILGSSNRDPGDETDAVNEDRALMAIHPFWDPTPARHANSARFHELLTEAGELHDRKQADYGRGDDPFANVRASSDWGMPAWVGAMVRASDKVKRLQKFASKGELANEPVIDAFMDLAVYALIARVLYEEAL